MSCTLESLIRLFLEWTGNNRAPGTASGYKRHLEKFALHVGNVDVGELRAHHLLTWGRTWHQIQAVQRLFSWAKNDAELIERNPFARVKKPTPRGRRRILSEREYARLVGAGRADWRRLLMVSRETLCRPQEARVLNFEELYHDESCRTLEEALPAGKAFFRLSDFKGRTRRVDPLTTRIIPVSARLGRLILWVIRKSETRSGEVIRTYRGKPWTKEKIRQRMRTARRRAGLVPDRAGERVCLYTIRHTMATLACARGVRDRVLADLLGHSTTRTTARYQHLQVPHLLDAMGQIHGRPGDK
jgi:site-specific recombinase XerD